MLPSIISVLWFANPLPAGDTESQPVSYSLASTMKLYKANPAGLTIQN